MKNIGGKERTTYKGLTASVTNKNGTKLILKTMEKLYDKMLQEFSIYDKFEGYFFGCPVYSNPLCPQNIIYILNPKYMKIKKSDIKSKIKLKIKKSLLLWK